MSRRLPCLLACLCAAACGYPLDEYPRTGIRRLLGYRLAQEGKLKTRISLPPGALLSGKQVQLRLIQDQPDFDITPATPRDSYLQAGIEKIFAARDPSYSIALLDISDPKQPRYAALREQVTRIPGSVGKILIATGLYGALARLYPNDTSAREKFLRETVITADRFVYRDSKTVPVFSEGAAAVVNRRIEAGDRFSLWEWIDHMLSQSSNAAASMVWKQALLLDHFGRRYPLPKAEEEAFFRSNPGTRLRELALACIEPHLRQAGLDTAKLRIGTFFTREATAVIPGTASTCCSRELLRWLIRMEQGRLVDAWTSLELKKMLYFARPRYRYAASPALSKAAVFFKSGSLFQCVPEPGFQCRPYQGNHTNLMHSVAVVESAGRVYLLAMMSNVLKVNSAVEHQTIGTLIEKLIQAGPR